MRLPICLRVTCVRFGAFPVSGCCELVIGALAFGVMTTRVSLMSCWSLPEGAPTND